MIQIGFINYLTVGFRHTHASLLAEAGADLKQIQDRLGYGDIQTTANIYTHVTNNKKDNTIDKLMSLEGQKDSQSLKTENKKPPTRSRWKKGLEIFIWEDKYSLWE